MTSQIAVLTLDSGPWIPWTPELHVARRPAGSALSFAALAWGGICTQPKQGATAWEPKEPNIEWLEPNVAIEILYIGNGWDWGENLYFLLGFRVSPAQ